MTDPTAGRKIHELQTRFLFPFYLKPLDDRGMQAASEALQGATILQTARLWHRAEPPALYIDELLQHVRDYLFPNAKSPADGRRCLYLKVPWMVQAAPGKESANVIQKWFQGAALLFSEKNPPCNGLSVKLVDNIGIELFLSPHGAGVLSISLTPGKDVSLTQEAAASYNYELAQLRDWALAPIHKAHPSDDPEKLNRIPSAERAKIEPLPAADAPLAERLTKRGGTFHLKELAAALLAPLQERADLKLDNAPHQHTCTLYTMACFDDAVDFGVASIRDELSPFLSGLAQIEEPTHAGAAADSMNVESLVNNRKHWAAVGLLGAAHLLAEQPPRPGHDEQRLPFNRLERTCTKYFIPYLLALMQRLSLNRAVDEASQFTHGEGEDGARRCKLLRANLVKFSVGGQFTQVHGRHSLHSFYQIARKGLDVPGAWEQIRQAITDTDAQHSARRQEILTQGMDRNLAIVAHTQQMVEWIEAFIISIYVGHFWHMLTAENTSLHDWVNETLHHWFGVNWHVEHWLVHGGVFILTLCSLGIALLILKPWKKDHEH
jgi:hypothetical protein